jgi:hypothetical protein
MMLSDIVPVTFDEAISNLKMYLDAENSEEVLAKWMAMDEGAAVVASHHSLGQALRNEWGLWSDTPLARDIHARFGLTHGDDMSGILILCVHRELNGLPQQPDAVVERFKVHWARSGGMPKAPWEW